MSREDQRLTVDETSRGIGWSEQARYKYNTCQCGPEAEMKNCTYPHPSTERIGSRLLYIASTVNDTALHRQTEMQAAANVIARRTAAAKRSAAAGAAE